MNGLARSWSWLKWVLATSLMGWLYYSNRTALSQIADTPKAWGYLVLALAVIGGSILVTFFRWYLLVRGQRIPFRLRDALRLGFIGLVANYVAPGSVGGDLVKAILMAREQSSRRAVAMATVLLDRALGMLSLLILGAVVAVIPSPALQEAVAQHHRLQAVGWLMWGGALCGLLGLTLLLTPAFTHSRLVATLTHIPRVGPILSELIDGVELYQSQRSTVLKALALGILSQGGIILGFYLCARWMNQEWQPSLLTHFFFMPSAELFGAFVPLPAGMGALEGAVQFFYEAVRPHTLPAEAAQGAGLLASLAFRVVTLAVAAFGGGYYLTARHKIDQALHESQPPPTPPVVPTPERPPEGVTQTHSAEPSA